MKNNGIFSRTKKKFKVTTKQDSAASFSANLLNGKFEAEMKNQIWSSDITYIRTNEGWMYLAVVLDVYNREIIGWSLSQRVASDLVVKALTMAVSKRKPQSGVIFHSDRGSQYTSSSVRYLLSKYGFRQSMSGKGNCYDNAITETFFSTLKKELVYLTEFETRQQAELEIFEFIEIFYNRKRLHSSLGYLSPVDFGMNKKIESKKEEIRINNNQTVAYLSVQFWGDSSELIKWIKETLNCQINAIIPTHFHDDCLGGLKAFDDNNIPSYANYKTIELAKENSFITPKNGFRDSLILKVGNENTIAKFFGEGHTKDNVVGYFPSENILFGGCLIKELDASKGYLGDANVTAWSGTVEKIKKEFPNVKIVVPGHGEYGNNKLLDYTINLFKTQ